MATHMETEQALRVARVVNEYTALDALRDVVALLSHVEEARQALERDVAGEGNTFGEGHPTDECVVCRRAQHWLPVLNGMMR